MSFIKILIGNQKDKKADCCEIQIFEIKDDSDNDCCESNESNQKEKCCTIEKSGE